MPFWSWVLSGVVGTFRHFVIIKHCMTGGESVGKTKHANICRRSFHSKGVPIGMCSRGNEREVLAKECDFLAFTTTSELGYG